MAPKELRRELTVDEMDAEESRYGSGTPLVGFPILIELQDALAILIVRIHHF